MALRHLGVVSIPVSDQDRATTFYVGTLGFEPLMDTLLEPEMRWIMLGLPGARTKVTLVTWFPAMPAGSAQGMVLNTDDIDADYQALQAKGVVFESALQTAPWGTFATFSDPDGNGWVLQQDA